MKYVVFVVYGFFLFAATSACAQQTPTTPKLVSDVHGETTSNLSPVYTDGKCHFRLKVVQGQRYSDRDYIFAPTKDNPAGWAFGFGCHAGASQEEIDGLLGLMYENGKLLWSATQKQFVPKQRFRLQKLVGANWTGRAVEYGALWGGDDAVQVFKFCISESGGPQVLCGNIQGLTVADPKYNKKREQKILAVLKTIVFVKPPASAPASASTAGTH